MHAGKQCPRVFADTRMRDVIYEMSSKALGMTCVVDDADALLGIITDGDLRRHMDKAPGIMELTAGQVMTRDPVTIPPATLAVEALNIMEQRKITSIVVDAGEKRVAGVVHLHDLWRTEMI
jgi:arabinose-5-phosphate isomerase